MNSPKRAVTLAVDIGGTWIKYLKFDGRGRAIGSAGKARTPRPALPEQVLAALAEIARVQVGFDRVSVGFPGVVELGIARTAANLHPAWIGRRLGPDLRRVFRRPVRVANDADLHGLAVIEGRGIELVLTLGTGVGSALFFEGQLIPNLELGHHPFERGRTYEQRLGDRALQRIGPAAWRVRLRRAVQSLSHAFHPRILYLGGGNARLVGRMPRGIRVVDNVAGLRGGWLFWAGEQPRKPRAAPR